MHIRRPSSHLVLSTALALAIVVSAVSCAPAETGTLQSAATALKATDTRSIEYAGTGKWFQFGQAPNPTLAWPAFDVSAFTAFVEYDTSTARIQMTRRQVVEPGRARPTPVEQRPVQLVRGTQAWSLTPAGAQAQPEAVEERTMEIWTTPQGFLKAALANNASAQPVEGGGSEVTFTRDGKYRYVGRINARNEVERVQTWIDNPVIGDTPVEFAYSDYRDFGDVRFPGRIVRTQGGHPALDLTITTVTANGSADIAVPAEVRDFKPAPVTVQVEKLADGVYYLKGGSHHSLAIDQRDHVIVIEAPQHEARSEAVIAKVKETIPNKPIRYLINSHVHFDHSGGLRTYVAEGATIVTHAMNRPYYEQVWAAPRTLNPDRLARTKASPSFETFTDKHVLTDGKRSVEVHLIAGNGHNDAYAMVYLPTEKILVQVDAFAAPAPNTPPPSAPNPFAVNLYENIERLKLDVRQMAPLHGPGVATVADLRTAIGRASGN